MKFLATALTLIAAVSALPAGEDVAALEPRATACTRAATDKMLFTNSMGTFQNARKHKAPSCFTWTSDGCSKSPDKPSGFNFLPSCQRHDFGYRNMKKQKRFTKAMKARVDSNLKKDLYKMCSAYHGLKAFRGVQCRRIADVYYAAVKKFGKRDEIPLDVEERDIQVEDLAIEERDAEANAEVEEFDESLVTSLGEVPEFDE